MPSAARPIPFAAIVAPMAMCCVMHQSIAFDAPVINDRREQEIERLSISARSQLMSFARAMWLREQGSPSPEACLWRLWESDWTAIRRTSVPQLPAWCRDVTADATATESRDYAITCLHDHSTSGFGILEATTDASPEAAMRVATRSTPRTRATLMASPSLEIQRTLQRSAAVEVATLAKARLARTGILETDSAVISLGVVSGVGLLD